MVFWATLIVPFKVHPALEATVQAKLFADVFITISLYWKPTAGLYNALINDETVGRVAVDAEEIAPVRFKETSTNPSWPVIFAAVNVVFEVEEMVL